MEAPLNPNLPEKKFKIETDENDYTPIENIPEEYLSLVIPEAKIFFTSDDEVDILDQVIRLKKFSLWMHEVFPMEDILLVPTSNKSLVVLHFMGGANVVADLTRRGLYKMNGKEVNLFELKAMAYKAMLKRGDNMFSFHINISPDDLVLLAEKYPELLHLASKKLTGESGPLNVTPYRINQVCYNLITDISGCKYIGLQARTFMFRCCVDLFINFSNQDRLSIAPARKYTGELKEALRKAVLYLDNTVKEVFSMAKMAYLLDMNAKELREAFESTYFITPEVYHLQRQMTHSYKMVIGSKTTPKEIGRGIGIRRGKEFIHLFETYFDCSFLEIRNAQ